MNITESDTDKCRLCLSEHDKRDLTPIFTDAELGLPLASRIMICLSLPVQAKDSFPDRVCKNCENQVTQFYAFREKCLNVYYSLLNRAIFCGAKETFCKLDDDIKNIGNASCADIEQAQFRHSEQFFEQNTPERYIVGIHERAIVDGDEKVFREHTNYDRNMERTSTNCARDYEVGEDADAIDATSHIRLQNPLSSFDNVNKDEPAAEEKVCDEVNTMDESMEIIKYKCLHCHNLFSDLDTATIHCTECLKTSEEVLLANTVDISRRVHENSYESQKSLNVSEEISDICWNKVSDVSADINSSATLQSQWETNSETSKAPNSQSPSRIGRGKTSESNSSHPCHICQSVFTSAALLRRHSFIHTGERPFECSICKKRFSQIGQLNFHKNFHENPRYRCDICKKPFLRPSDIAKHMRTHTGEKPYGCDVCSKSFAQLVALQQHERIHTGDKPYICEICGKTFSQKANKTKHVKIHKEGAKPHTCGICGRSFSDVEEMNLHSAGHGGGKPRKCDYCDESFRKMSELSQHTRRYHTFEKSHKCSFCQKAFYSMYNLKQHVMVHTGQKPYACSHCDLKFTQKGNLTKHFERKHTDRASNEDGYFDDKLEDDCSEDKEREIWMLANDLLKNANDPSMIERGETTGIQTMSENME